MLTAKILRFYDSLIRYSIYNDIHASVITDVELPDSFELFAMCPSGI